MARAPTARWHKRDQKWLASIGEGYTDKNGRFRRREVALRYDDGNLIPRHDRKAATAAVAKGLETIKPRAVGDNKPILLDLVDWYLCWQQKQAEAGLLQPETVDVNKNVLSWFLGFDKGEYAYRAIDSFGYEDLDRVVAKRRAEGKAPSYINRIIQSVVALFSWGAKRIIDRGIDASGRPIPTRLLDVNAFSSYPRIKPGPSEEKYCDRKEAARFLRFVWNQIHPERLEGERWTGPVTGLKHCAERSSKARDVWKRHLVLLIRTIFWTGCRPKELITAKWENVDWLKSTISLDKHKTASKTGKRRVIFLTPTLARALARIHASAARNPQYIFAHRLGRNADPDAITSQGQPWQRSVLGNAIRKWRDEAVAAGVLKSAKGPNRFHLYRLRHTRASDGLMKGLSEAAVAEALGTSPVMIRRTYGHILEGHVRKAADVMASK